MVQVSGSKPSSGPTGDIDGSTVGSFAVIDGHPRAWTATEILQVEDFARVALTELQLQQEVRRRCEAETALRKADRRKDEFIAVLAHELRNRAGEPLPAPPQPGGAAGARRVLIVEDNRDAAETLAELLRASGYSVSIAHDGHAAIALSGYANTDARRRSRRRPTSGGPPARPQGRRRRTASR